MRPPWIDAAAAGRRPDRHRHRSQPGLRHRRARHDAPVPRGAARARARIGVGPLVDLGCGSGVLAIAAARLGWAPVLGIDHEHAAVARRARERRGQRRADRGPPRRPAARRAPAPSAPTVVANLLRPLLEHVARAGFDGRAAAGARRRRPAARRGRRDRRRVRRSARSARARAPRERRVGGADAGALAPTRRPGGRAQRAAPRGIPCETRWPGTSSSPAAASVASTPRARSRRSCRRTAPACGSSPRTTSCSTRRCCRARRPARWSRATSSCRCARSSTASIHLRLGKITGAVAAAQRHPRALARRQRGGPAATTSSSSRSAPSAARCRSPASPSTAWR